MSVITISRLLVAGFALSSEVFAAQSLSLAEAVQKALQKNPQLEAIKAQEEVAAAGVDQAGRWANPEVSFSIEDFAGDTGLSAKSATSIWQLSQPMMLPGKRSSQREAALATRDVVAIEVEMERQAFIRRVRGAYIDVASAECGISSHLHTQLHST